ncbi:MAG: cation transporter [Rhodospirillales bacterium]|nr:cation transporter [Rhodospirillales bacterium]
MSRAFQFFMIGLAPIALGACVNSEPAAANQAASTAVLGVDLGSSASRSPAGVVPEAAKDEAMPGMTMEDGSMPGMKMAHEGHSDAHATGTVNSVDAAQHKLNISHGPISAIGWPAMTMDFPAAPAVDLTSLKPGSRVDFTLVKGKDGMYQVESVKPASRGG